MPRMRWTLDQKKHHVAAWRASGLTREQYCELYDIPFKSLRQWPQDVAKAEKRVSRTVHSAPFVTTGYQYRRPERVTGYVAGRKRGSEVLAQCAD